MSTQPPIAWAPSPRTPRSRFPRWAVGLIVGSVVVFWVPLAWQAYQLFPVFMIAFPWPASDKPPKPEFSGFDACSLITPRDADHLGAWWPKVGPPPSVVSRVVQTSRAGLPIDTCVYDVPTAPTAGVTAAPVQASVSPAAVIDEDDPALAVDKRSPVPGVGDQAYVVVEDDIRMVTVVGRRGASQFKISARRPIFTTLDEEEREDQLEEYREDVIDLAREIAGKVPPTLTVPGMVATGRCAALDAEALTAGLGSPVTHSRSHQGDDQTVCTYATAQGSEVLVQLTKDVDDESLSFAEYGKSVQAGSRTGWEYDGEVNIIEGKALLQVDFDVARHPNPALSADLSAADLALAGAAANALLD